MKMHTVKSSNITNIGHSGNIMHVTYKSGDTYEFTGVSSDKYKKIMTAKSIGSHLSKFGKKGIKLEKK